MTDLKEALDPKDGPDPMRWHVRYVIASCTAVFMGRSIGSVLLPVALARDYHQTGAVVGLIIGVYAASALTAMPISSRIARGTSRIVGFHVVSLIALALAMALMSLAPVIQATIGDGLAIAWIFLSRVAQGIGMSVFLSAQTSLITRKFPDSEYNTYVVSMVQVAVGGGNQAGRGIGGLLYQLGGFSCPFLASGLLMALCGVWGVVLQHHDSEAEEEEDDDPAAHTEEELQAAEDHEEHSGKVPFRELLTLRSCVGALAAFNMYFAGCWMDTILPMIMLEYLHPISVAGMALLLAVRSSCYLMGAYMIGQILTHRILSFEMACLLGIVIQTIFYQLVLPEPFVNDLLLPLFGGDEQVKNWFCIMFSTCVVNLGNAMSFVAGLPLMQSEVRHHGTYAMEQVGEIFVIAMTLGESLGPIVGGWVSGELGYSAGLGIMFLYMVPQVIATAMGYDSRVIISRHKDAVQDEADAMIAQAGDAPRRQRSTMAMAHDVDGAVAVRAIPYTRREKRGPQVPQSVPSTVFRRMYSTSRMKVKPYESEPASAMRRQYKPPKPPNPAAVRRSP